MKMKTQKLEALICGLDDSKTYAVSFERYKSTNSDRNRNSQIRHFDESGNFLDIAWYPERDLNPHSLAAEGF